jgi:cytochrome b561
MDMRKAWGHWGGTAHGLLAKLAYVLIALHVAGALKHQFFDRDNLIARMAPFLGRALSKETVRAP